jgi:hypothetical protein
VDSVELAYRSLLNCASSNDAEEFEDGFDQKACCNISSQLKWPVSLLPLKRNNPSQSHLALWLRL